MHLLSLTRRLSSLLIFGALLPQAVSAQTVTTDEYIYIGFEAEDHVVKNERWVLTTPTTPTEENDPDGNHSDQASGSTYLELLPDIRVTHEDGFGPPTAYWGQGGQGPDADYQVDFPEPGRYYVHVRAYSTGTEDNGLHIGIDGTWPASGQRMQFCTASKRAWWWSSAQRDAGGNGSCGIEKSIWLDVDTAGMHTVSISAREDGFEIDRLALVKDLSNNTRVCTPTNINDVSCRNGSIESADGFVDLRVRLETLAVDVDPDADPEADPPNPTVVEQGRNMTLTAKIENLDAFDTANNIVLTLSPVAGEWEMVDMDARCAADADEFKCTLDDLHPTAPNENAPFVFTLQALVSGELRIDAALLSDEVDESPANDVAATVVSVPGDTPIVLDTDVKLQMQTDKQEYEVDEAVQLSIVINNVSANVADNVLYSVAIPDGLALNSTSLPDQCSVDGDLQCAFTSIASGDSESISVELMGASAGIYTFSGSVSADNDVNSTNNLDSDSIVVEEVPEETTTAGNADVSATDGTTASTAGATDGAATDGGDSDAGAGDTTGDTTSTDGEGVQQADSGAMTHWFFLLLLVLGSARLYGWHQRQGIAIRK